MCGDVVGEDDDEDIFDTLLRNTTGFDFDGELEFARLPEIGMINCPLKIKTAIR